MKCEFCQSRMVSRIEKNALDCEVNYCPTCSHSFVEPTPEEKRLLKDEASAVDRGNRLARECQDLQEENERLSEALKFYAGLAPFKATHPCDVDVRFQIDGGDAARAALNPKGEVKS